MSREIGKSSAAFPFWEGTRAGRWSTVQVQRYEHSGLARITPRVKGHRKSREACAAVPAAEETQLSFSKRTQGRSPRYLQSLALRLKPHPDTNRSRWRVFQQPREAVHVQNGDAAPRLGRLRPSLARPDEAVTEPRTPLRGLGRLPALPGLTRLLKNCAVPTGVASNFPLYPALRLRLRARLRLFRAYGTGFRHFCPTVVRAPRVS